MRIVSLDDPGNDLGAGEPRRDPHPRPAGHEGLPGPPRRHRRDDRRRRAGCTPGTSGGWTPTAGCSSSTGSRNSSSTRATRSPPPTWRPCCSPTPRIADAAVIGVLRRRRQRGPQGLRGPPAGRGRTSARTTSSLYVAERVAPYKKVRRVDFIDGVPARRLRQDPAARAARPGRRRDDPAPGRPTHARHRPPSPWTPRHNRNALSARLVAELTEALAGLRRATPPSARSSSPTPATRSARAPT